MKNEIESGLNPLIGLELQEAGRASNLFWLGTGPLATVQTKRGSEIGAEYSLHIQCSWRLSAGKKIIAGSRDFYSPSSQWNGEMDDFDWDEYGNNRFDERIQLFNGRKRKLIVEKIVADDLGGCILSFSDGVALEVFPDSSDEDPDTEYWRLFNWKEKSPHFVVNGLGIDVE
ncbi:hypothetical protein CEF21_06955 [Bacillus sp. FJAT-42376]|uniref:hypothetical protein n=1 Tax=Bacillus sp. FJAT-42376 TaxID=2014076 RepID=UPI000F4E48A8|nr:hypothetical protein [Bacillus sp. FJAT-42376]AZB42048.1 hypothetical protein CEF21_06955 [Bacillus sp. FJAT-42376]